MERPLNKAVALVATMAIGTSILLTNSAQTTLASTGYTVISQEQANNLDTVSIVLPDQSRFEGYLYENKTYAPIGMWRQLSSIYKDSEYGTELNVNYDNATKDVSVNINKTTGFGVSVYISSGGPDISVKILNNGKILATKTIQAKVLNVSGRIYIPVSIFRDLVHLNINWDNDTRTVTTNGIIAESTDLSGTYKQLNLDSQKIQADINNLINKYQQQSSQVKNSQDLASLKSNYNQELRALLSVYKGVVTEEQLRKISNSPEVSQAYKTFNNTLDTLSDNLSGKDTSRAIVDTITKQAGLGDSLEKFLDSKQKELSDFLVQEFSIVK